MIIYINGLWAWTSRESLRYLNFHTAWGFQSALLYFFNHFSRKKLTTDPTPIHVEMRNYESQVNKALIEDASREGKTIDVS